MIYALLCALAWWLALSCAFIIVWAVLGRAGAFKDPPSSANKNGSA